MGVHLFGIAFGGMMSHRGGEDTPVIGWTVVSFLSGVGGCPFPGLRTVASLVGKVVVFTRTIPASGVGCHRGGVPQQC